MGRHTKLNQSGMTIFEISIVVLILALITVSAIYMVKMINATSSRSNTTVHDTSKLGGQH